MLSDILVYYVLVSFSMVKIGKLIYLVYMLVYVN